jgi:hypothetical protein
MTYAPIERFEIARVLIRMTGVLSRNFRVLAVLALVLSGLPNLVIGMVERGFLSNPNTGVMGLFGFGWLFSLLIGALLQAALIHGTISDLNGRRASIGDCLNTAVRHVLPLIGIGIAMTVATFLGLFLFVVPGVILALALCVSAPVRVVEGLGVFSSLGRSGDLTRNHRGAILLMFILFGIGTFVLQALLGLMFGKEFFGIARATGNDLFMGRSFIAAFDIRTMVINPLFQSLTALIGAAGVASIYFELRTIKEGIGIEALAAAFD